MPASPPAPGCAPVVDTFESEIAVAEPTMSVRTSAAATSSGTHFEGFFGGSWSGRGAQPAGEGEAGWDPDVWPNASPGCPHPGGAGIPWVAPGQRSVASSSGELSVKGFIRSDTSSAPQI